MVKRILFVLGVLCLGLAANARAQSCTGADACPQPDDPCLERTCIKPRGSNRGTCGVQPAAAGSPCGDFSSSECDAPDVCDGTGTCIPNFVPAGASCGNGSSSECDAPDSCDGAGACAANHVADDTACEGAVCTAGETCQAGACSGGTAIEGCCLETADCDNGVTCDGTESCVDNSCADGVPVSCDDANACTVDACQEPDASCSNTLVALDPADVASVMCNVEAALSGAGLDPGVDPGL